MLRHKRLPLALLVVGGASAIGVESAAAAPIRVPMIMEGCYLIIRLLSMMIEAIGSSWLFIIFIAYMPLKKLLLGAVVTVGGAFLPDIGVPKRLSGKAAGAESGEVTIDLAGKGKLSFKGAPRYAVLVVGILIVASSLWDGYSAAH